MKKKAFKTHLKPYSIFQKRKTTINHAFASALSVADVYNEVVIDKALRLLGQDPDGDLTCVYCDAPAQTLDHIEATVKDGRFSGIGHQIGNLAPCCKPCNSSKGNRHWIAYIDSLGLDKATRDRKVAMLTAYIGSNVVNIMALMQQECHTELERIEFHKQEALRHMQLADEEAAEARRKLLDKLGRN